MDTLKLALSAQRGCRLHFLFVDITDRDLVAGLLLGRIVYWFSPDSRGVPRVRVKKEGKTWLAKSRSDWWDETRITEDQYDRASKVLVDLGLIEVRNFHFAGRVTPHIWLNQVRLSELLLETIGEYEPAIEPEIEGDDDPEPTAPATGDRCPRCHIEPSVPNDPKHRCKYCFVADAWEHYFPGKPKPDRKNKTYRDAVDARWKEPEFRQRFFEALARGSLSGHLQDSGWFHVRFFLSTKGGERNWKKPLDGMYDSFDRDRRDGSYERLQQFDGRGQSVSYSAMGG